MIDSEMITADPSTTNAAKLKTYRVLMFDVTLPAASFLYNLSNLVLVVGAFLVLGGTWGAIQMGAVKERFTDERISANEKETMVAQSDAARANAEAARAQENAARANERASSNELQVAAANRATEELKAQNLELSTKLHDQAAESYLLERQVNPRYINDDEKEILRRGLHGIVSRIHVVSLPEPEPQIFAESLIEALRSIGIEADYAAAPSQVRPDVITTVFFSDNSIESVVSRVMLMAFSGSGAAAVQGWHERRPPRGDDWMQDGTVLIGRRFMQYVTRSRAPVP